MPFHSWKSILRNFPKLFHSEFLYFGFSPLCFWISTKWCTSWSWFLIFLSSLIFYDFVFLFYFLGNFLNFIFQPSYFYSCYGVFNFQELFSVVWMFFILSSSCFIDTISLFISQRTLTIIFLYPMQSVSHKLIFLFHSLFFRGRSGGWPSFMLEASSNILYPWLLVHT